MALDMLNIQDPLASLGSSFGSALGGSLAGGLDALAEHKIKQLTEQKKIEGFRSLKGPNGQPLLTAEESAGLANVDPKIAEQFLKQKLQMPARMEYAQGLNALLGGGQGQGQQGMQQGGSNLDFSNLNEKQATDLAKLGQKQKQLNFKQEESVRKYLEPFQEKREKLEKGITNYKLLRHIAQKGDLRSGNLHAALDKAGLAGFGKNIDTQVAEKSIADLGLGIKGEFGANAKITNFLEQTFQKTNPNLWNTPEGIETLSNINIAKNKLGLKDIQVTEQIIRDNGGTIPWDIGEKKSKILAPFKDKLGDKLIAEIAIPQLPNPKKFNTDNPDQNIEYAGQVFTVKNGHWKLVS